MQRKSVPDPEPSQKNIMSVILQSIPQESDLTKIEYEGPRIALYSRNPSYLLQNNQLISNMVNAIKKRIVVRSDESIRKTEVECIELITAALPAEIGFTNAFFDGALGEATVFVKRPWLLTQFSDEVDNADLLEKTGWRTRIRKTPADISALIDIYRILGSSSTERTRFLRDVGNKIFRSPLVESAEASLIALGGYAEVGRSCSLLVTGDSKIIIDAGLNLSSKNSLSALPRFDLAGIGMDEIDAVVLSHAHLDHSGFVPFLYKYGYRGPVYCTEPTLPLMYLLQKDYLRSASEKALYSDLDVEEMVTRTITLNYGSVTDLSPDLKLVLSNAGHILGSASVHIHIGSGDHNLVYTGDMKFGKTISLENASWNFPRVETLIIESTYGGKEDGVASREQAEIEFAGLLNSTVQQAGNVLIPVPVAGVSQELVLLLDSLIQSGKIWPQVQIILDGSIAKYASVYEAYPEYLDKELRSRVLRSENSQFGFSDNFVVSNSIATLDRPSIILAPTGTLTGGSSVEYLKIVGPDATSRLLFVSYQPLETPGRAIQEGLKRIVISGSALDLRCQINSISGLDLHSDRNQLMAYINRLKPKLRRVLVNHGERLKAQNLASSISRLLRVPAQHPLVQEAVKLL